MGCISKKNVELILNLVDPEGLQPELMIDLMDPEFQRPSIDMEPFVEGCPPTARPSATAKEVYLMMKVAHGENVIYITRQGALLGEITFSRLMSFKPGARPGSHEIPKHYAPAHCRLAWSAPAGSFNPLI